MRIGTYRTHDGNLVYILYMHNDLQINCYFIYLYFIDEAA